MSARATYSGMTQQDAVRVLARSLDADQVRIDNRRDEIISSRHALAALIRSLGDTASAAMDVNIEVIPAENAADVVNALMEEAEGMVRNCARTVEAGPALADSRIADVQARLKSGLVHRSIYPLAALDTSAGRRWIRAWAEAGEEQRLSEDPPSEFLVAGTRAVVAVSTWNDPLSTHLLIREPMLVQAFIAVFDLAYAQAIPATTMEVPENTEVLELLALGVKDEAIARALGWSLRTVRRRVATLMEHYGVDTRFQLGVAAASMGDLQSPSVASLRGSGARR